MSVPALVVVMPAYNEADCIEGVLSGWHEVLCRVAGDFLLMVVNDGSRDGTAALVSRTIARLGPSIVLHDRQNGGHGRACRFGYERALEVGARWVLQVDSDGQCNPSHFPAFWGRRREGDCVFGARARGDGWTRRLLSLAGRTLVGVASGVFLRDPNVPYRLVRASSLRDALARVPPEIEMQNMALAVALARRRSNRWCSVPIDFPARRGGTSSLNVGRMARMGCRMLGELRRVA